MNKQYSFSTYNMFKQYKRTNLAMLRYVNQDDIDSFNTNDGILFVKSDNGIIQVSISNADLINGSPEIGDMIAVNPEDITDQWLISAYYSGYNFDLINDTKIENIEIIGQCIYDNKIYDIVEISDEVLLLFKNGKFVISDLNNCLDVKSYKSFSVSKCESICDIQSKQYLKINLETVGTIDVYLDANRLPIFELFINNGINSLSFSDVTTIDICIESDNTGWEKVDDILIY